MLAIALAALLVFGLTACGGTIEKADTPVASAATDAAGETAQTKQVVVGVSMGATTMDPAHEYEWDAEMMLHSVYPTLVTSDYADESKILPCVASKWVISDDGLTYTFTLNQGIQFTTGNGAATPAGIIPKGFLGYAGETTITRDVEKAKALLTEAGYPDGITFSMGVIPDMAPDSDKRAELFAEIQKRMDEKNAPAVVLLQPGKTWAVSSRLKNLTVSAAFCFDFVSLDVQ